LLLPRKISRESEISVLSKIRSLLSVSVGKNGSIGLENQNPKNIISGYYETFFEPNINLNCLSLPLSEEEIKTFYKELVKSVKKELKNDSLEKDDAIEIITNAKKATEQALLLYPIYKHIMNNFKFIAIKEKNKIKLGSSLSKPFLTQLEKQFGSSVDLGLNLDPSKKTLKNPYSCFKEVFEISSESKITYTQVMDIFWNKVKELDALLVQN
jgi:hypothetical protein